MGNFGFLAFGASVIWLANTVLERAQGSRDRGLLMFALLPLCAAASAVLLIPSLLHSKSVDYFPIGMLLAIWWLGMEASLRTLATGNFLQNTITVLKFVLVSAATFFLLSPILTYRSV